MKRSLLASAVLGLVAFGSAQAADVELRLHYAHPNLWKTVQEKIAEEFMARNPGIKIAIDAPAKTYADGAQQLLREAVAIYEQALPEGHSDIARARNQLGACLAALGRDTEAEPLLRDGFERLRENLGPAHRWSQAALHHLLDFYDARARAEEADAFRVFLGAE